VSTSVELNVVVSDSMDFNISGGAVNQITNTMSDEPGVNVAIAQANEIQITQQLPDITVTSTGNIELEYGSKYFGNPGQDGSWRMRISDTGDLVVEKRESGAWVEKGAYF